MKKEMHSDQRAASINQHRLPITTYVRQTQPFEEEEKAKELKHFHNKTNIIRSSSLERLGIRPHSTRTIAFIRLLSNWEGRDALLQFAQSVSLLAYSMAPFQRRQLHITSESLANARRVLIVGRWLNEGLVALQENWQSKQAWAEDCSSSSSSAMVSDEEEHGKREGRGSETSVRQDNNHRIKSWNHIWQRRVGMFSEYLTMTGEGCEVLAFLGGSSVMWRIMGNKLAARQRHGLERLAQYIFFFAFLFTLRHMENLREKRSNKLRRCNQQLLQAADRLTDEADASTLLQADHLSITEALSHDRNKANLIHPQNLNDQVEGEKGMSYANSALRRAEYRLFLQRKKAQLLKLERTSVRAELIFVIAELVWPEHDHARLEGWTTLIASLCHMSRLTKQTRWH